MMKISIYRRIFRESLTDGIFGTFFSVFKLYIQLLSFNQKKIFLVVSLVLVLIFRLIRFEYRAGFLFIRLKNWTSFGDKKYKNFTDTLRCLKTELYTL